MPKYLNTVNLVNNKIINLGDPTASQDAATKKYVDDLLAGRDNKEAVKAASTGNLALSGAQTIDGVSVVAGDRVLVKNQTTASDNGIYIAATGAWSRAADANTWAELASAFVIVEQGTVNAEKVFLSTTNTSTGTLGTTAIPWTEFGTVANYTAGGGITISGQTVSANVDNTTIEVSSTQLRVKDGGITESKLSSTTAGDGLIQNATSKKLEVRPDNTTIELTGTTPNKTVQVKNTGITTAKLADSSVTTPKIADGSLTTVKYADTSVTSAKLAASAVPLNGDKVTGTLPVTKGGTGATTAANARWELGASSTYKITLLLSDVADLVATGINVIFNTTPGSYSINDIGVDYPGKILIDYYNIPNVSAGISDISVWEGNGFQPAATKVYPDITIFDDRLITIVANPSSISTGNFLYIYIQTLA